MAYRDDEQPASKDIGQPPGEHAAVPASLLPSVLSSLGLGDTPTAQGDDHGASLRDKESSMRVAAVRRAGEGGEAASLEFLVSALRDPAWEVRAAAVWALSTCGEQAPVEILFNALADEDGSVRAAALRTLCRINGPASLVPALRLLRDAEWQVREAAALTLGELGEQASLEPLMVSLHDENAFVRQATQAALEQSHSAAFSLPFAVPGKASDELSIDHVPGLPEQTRRYQKRRLQPMQIETSPMPSNAVPKRKAAPRKTRFPHPAPSRHLWPQRFNILAAALFAALLVGSLVFTFSRIDRSRTGMGSVGASPVTIKTPVDLTEGLRLYMVNEQTGWAVGDDAHTPYATVLRTTDGGKHWLDVTPPGVHEVAELYILDEKTVWLPLWDLGKQASILPIALDRTIDGGATWQHFACPQSLPCGLATFTDQNHGWLVYQPPGKASNQLKPSSTQAAPPPEKLTLYHSSDGGKTWQSTGNLPFSVGIPQWQFLNDQIGWISTCCPSGGKFYATRDGGRSWKVQLLPTPQGETPYVVSLPTFINESEGYLVARYGQTGQPGHSYVYTTQDGGNSWQTSSNALPDNVGLRRLLDMQHAVVSTNDSIFILTLTDGRLVKVYSPPKGTNPLVDYSFISARVGLIIVDASPRAFDVYKTTNGGQMWQKISTMLKST